MTDEQLKEIQQQMFFELGHKVDVYHFERIREIVIVKHGDPLIMENAIKVFHY
jgi:hypothetical protein